MLSHHRASSFLVRVGGRCSYLHPAARRWLAAVGYARCFRDARRWPAGGGALARGVVGAVGTGVFWRTLRT